MNTRTLLPLLACTALCACTVGPRFKRPAPPRTEAYLTPREQAEAQSPQLAERLVFGAAPPARWWTQFDSPELDALIERAVAANHTLAAARARLAEARELVKAQEGARFPQVDLVAGAGRQKYGKEFLGSLFVLPPFSYTAAGAAVSYTLDYVGGVARTVEQRRALAQYQRSETDATYLALTGSVVTQAMGAAAARAEIAAIAALVKEDRDNLRLVRTAYAAGSVSRVDVLTAESQLSSDETLLPPVRQRLAQALHAVAVLLGEAPSSGTGRPLELASLKLPRELPVSLPSAVARRRPDILAAEAQLHAATAAVGIATAQLYPQITLTATGGYQSLPFQQLFTTANGVWSLIGGLTAPVFHGGTLRAERRASIDELRASSEDYQQVVLEAFGQIADLLDALSHDSQLVAAQSKALAAAQSNAELARESYSAGNSGLLEVIDAERRRLAAQIGLVRAQAEQYVDTAQLYLALGGGPLK